MTKSERPRGLPRGAIECLPSGGFTDGFFRGRNFACRRAIMSPTGGPLKGGLAGKPANRERNGQISGLVSQFSGVGRSGKSGRMIGSNGGWVPA